MLPDRAAPSQSMTGDQRPDARSTASLAVLRQVVADLDYTLDALAAAMGKDRSFIHRVLGGEKPMPPAFLDALPDDIEAEWHARRAAAFGRVVVERTGLIGLVMAPPPPALPARASGMARATLPASPARKAGAR
jgi:hypothetical protein